MASDLATVLGLMGRTTLSSDSKASTMGIAALCLNQVHAGVHGPSAKPRSTISL